MPAQALAALGRLDSADNAEVFDFRQVKKSLSGQYLSLAVRQHGYNRPGGETEVSAAPVRRHNQSHRAVGQLDGRADGVERQMQKQLCLVAIQLSCIRQQ